GPPDGAGRGQVRDPGPAGLRVGAGRHSRAGPRGPGPGGRAPRPALLTRLGRARFQGPGRLRPRGPAPRPLSDPAPQGDLGPERAGRLTQPKNRSRPDRGIGPADRESCAGVGSCPSTGAPDRVNAGTGPTPLHPTAASGMPRGPVCRPADPGRPLATPARRSPLAPAQRATAKVLNCKVVMVSVILEGSSTPPWSRTGSLVTGSSCQTRSGESPTWSRHRA